MPSPVAIANPFAPRNRSPVPSGILVAGIGNLLLTDDGIGVHVLRELQKEPMPGVTLAEIGTSILHGLSFVESASRVLVIDAVRGGEAPGTLYCFDAGPATRSAAGSSLHALGLIQAMRCLLPGPPPPVHIIGVEPQSLAYGMEISPCVQAALPRLVALARNTVAQWLEQHHPAISPHPVPS